MRELLYEVEEMDNQEEAAFIWEKKAGEWYCCWLKDAFTNGWIDFETGSISDQDTPLKGDPRKVYSTNTFRKITEAELFVMLL